MFKDTGEYIDAYIAEAQRITDALPRDRIEAVVDLLFQAWRNGRQVFIMGNGGSAGTATHFVCDLAKCTIVEDKPRFKVMGLTDNMPLVSAWTNDSGFGTIFSEQLRPWLQEGDVLMGLSVHGGSGEGDAGPWSQNLVKAIRLAKERKAKIIGFSGFGGGL